MIAHISEAANLAIHALSYIANHPDEEPVSNKYVSSILNASEAHLSKVFQRLVKVGLVRSIRGPKGGFSLAKAPKDITLLEIYEAIDGKIPIKECLFGHQNCNRYHCVFGDYITNINVQINNHFSTTTLADAIEKN
jgi:Rrf2 family protein